MNKRDTTDSQYLPVLKQKAVFGSCLLPKNLVERFEKQKIYSLQQLPPISALTSSNPKVMVLSRIGDFLQTCRDVQNKFGQKGYDQKVLLTYLYTEEPEKRWQQVEKALRKLFSGGLQTYSSHVNYTFLALQYALLLPEFKQLMSELKLVADVLKVPLYDLIIETASAVKQESFNNFSL